MSPEKAKSQAGSWPVTRRRLGLRSGRADARLQRPAWSDIGAACGLVFAPRSRIGGLLSRSTGSGGDRLVQLATQGQLARLTMARMRGWIEERQAP
jgi:hypothetical protein